MVTVLSTLPWTTFLDVALSSAVPVLSGQWPPALLTGSPGELSLQLEVTEDIPFAHEMRSTSKVRVAPTASATGEATGEPSKDTSEATSALDAKESKPRGRRRKSRNNLGVAIQRRICLREAVMKAIPMEKPMERRMMTSGVDRALEMERRKEELIANRPNRARLEHAARKANSHARARWLPNPQRLNPL